MKPLLLVLLMFTSCRGPDYLETSVYQGEGFIDGSRANDYDQDSRGLMLTAGWHAGQQGEAMKNLAALDVSKAGVLRTESYGPISVDLIAPEHDHGVDVDPEAEGRGKLWAALATVVTVGVGGLIHRFTRRSDPE